ncbi:(2Fe-2S) ferredoxin domain-containing protein [Desulfovibrio inopinatus]|uniref:(2Fe-2S) ferredoxin domain-containing protein n=1 Tax=Desulfovibrio inopinatus TaxID=102109 RepID=UPI0003F8FAED|nr:(2Fe-2S) ferredoxin domain-containing protein [Desulfovibrio inopinatus]
MEKPEYHILVCNSFRAKGDPKGVCNKKAADLMPYLDEEILDRGLDALVTSTGCLKQCEDGPVMVVYPQGYWYGKVESEEIVDEILDALEDGEPCEKYLLT